MTSNDNLVVVRFYNHPVLNEARSKAENRPVYDDMVVCEQKYAGDRQKVGVFPAHEPFRHEDDPVTGMKRAVTYAIAFPDQYRAFKNGAAQAMSGTPVEELPFLTQAKRYELKALNIHTAEALAALDGQPLKQLGMGGRELKNKAQAYLDSAHGSADTAALAAEVARLREENARLRGDASGPVEDDDGDPKTSPFQSWDGEDIRNWIKANGGNEPRANATHAKLVKAADHLNAKLAEQAESSGSEAEHAE